MGRQKHPLPEGDDEDDLFDICRNYHGGNPESEAANASAGKVGGWLKTKAVLEQVGYDGANGWEVEQATDLLHQSGSARLSEAKARGETILKPDGRGGYVKRPTGTGRLAAVHILPKFKPPGVIVSLEL